MRNPLRSERDVFHAVVAIGVGAAAVIALALLTRPLFGAALLAAEAFIGVRVLWNRAHEAPAPDLDSHGSEDVRQP
jgi:hypothetical protein